MVRVGKRPTRAARGRESDARNTRQTVTLTLMSVEPLRELQDFGWQGASETKARCLVLFCSASEAVLQGPCLRKRARNARIALGPLRSPFIGRSPSPPSVGTDD